MKKLLFTFSMALLTLVLDPFLGRAFAQVDPSAALLLRSSGRAPEKQNLDSSRYQVRPGASSRNTDVGSRPLQSATDATNRVETQSDKTSEAAENTAQAGDQSDQVIGVATAEVKPISNETQWQPIADRDVRKNIVDLHIAPVYVYNESSGNFWFRQFTQHAPGFQVGADIWFTPDFAFNTTYMTTTASSIDGSFADDGRISVENDWFSGDLKFRKSFSNAINSSMLILAVGYREYEMRVSSLADERIGTKSSGVHVKAEVLLSQGPTCQWSLGAEYMPRVSHQEVASEIDVKSGDDNESSMVGVHLGGRFILSREHQMFWRLSHSIERNLFSGQSNINDPRATPARVTGVEITNSFTIFSLGYTWGN
ncbi:MAG: hypothetical protein HRT45_18110 [Bdellovibrionales bacterium]|nr:hypothetical protein [Bdellovibrionales bacterium]